MKKYFYQPLLFVMLLLACDTEEIVQLEEETQRTEPNFDLESFAIDELPDIEVEIGN